MANHKVKQTILRRTPIAAAVVMGLTSQVSLAATITVNNTGNSTTTLTPVTYSAGDTLNMTNTATGNINVSGTGTQAGISGVIGGNSVINVTNNGTISATTTSAGDVAFGIRADGGSANITNTGNITALSPYSANAIQSITTTGATTIVSHGNLTATDTAIFAEMAGNNANLSVTASGKIQSGLGTVGTRDALELYTNGTNSNITVDFQSGSIETFDPTGTNGTARGITAVAVNDGSVTVKTGANTTIKTASTSSNGINAVSNGTTTKRNVTVDSSSNITTSGYTASGIRTVDKLGDTTINSKGAITTSGFASHGITATGNGKIDIINAGNITATGVGSLGIYAAATGTDDLSITHKAGATIKTTGAGLPVGGRVGGIHGFKDSSDTGNILITVDGDISVDAANRGSGAYAQHLGVGNATVVGTGNVTASATALSGTNIYSYGLAATVADGTASAGDASVYYSKGTIKTGGDQAYALYAAVVGKSGKTTVGNSGTLSTTGSKSSAIFARNDVTNAAGKLDVTNSGVITTSGAASHGIETSMLNGDTAINNTGAITTTGLAAGGIHATNKTGDIKITSTGDIKAQGTGTVKSLNPSASSNDEAHAIIGVSNGNGNIIINASGTLETNGYDASGVRGYISNALSTGDITLNYTGPSITSYGDNGDALFAQTAGTGNVTVTSSGGSLTTFGGGTTTGTAAHGIVAMATSGTSSVTNSSTISTGLSADSFGITARATTGAVNVNNTGDISTEGLRSHGIHSSATTGDIQINNQGDLTVDGEEASGVRAISSAGGNITVLNSGEIITNGVGTINGAAGIRAIANGAGNVTVISTGANITTNGAGTNNHGIEAVARNGAAHAELVNGTISVSGKSAGIAAWNYGSGLASSGEVIISNGIVDATRSYDQVAVQAFALDSGSVDIDAGSQVHGGWDNLSGTIYSGRAVAVGGATQSVNNAGVIDALSDKAVAGDATTAGNLSINNSGQITGSITSVTGNATLTNTGTWDIRNFADTDGDQVRDTLSVAVNDFGTSGNNSISNSGVITLLGDNAQATTLNNTGEYATGYAANTLALGGAAQGQILGVQTFTNSGVIDLSANSSVGDVLLISGSNTAGTAGGGVYIADGGQIKVDTVLNEGGLTNSQSDMLVVDSTRLGSGATSILVNNVGGTGANTVDNGIEVVRVLDSANSAAGVFKLDSRTTAGLYEYDLFKGAVDANTADGNWYLRTLKTPDNEPAINPESTVYLRNLNAASTMFMHTLHDRLGEPQFTDPYKTDDNNPSSAWVRVVSNHTDSVGGNGQVDLNTDTNLVHLGTDIARWSSDGNDRWLFGVMGAYGQSKIDASAKYFAVTPSGFERNATGKVDGYSVGAYATWYGNKDKPEGAYVDTWAQYGWYDNKVQGNTKAEERYNSSGWTASVEAGYALIARDEGNNRQWIFEPQVQVAYNNYSSNDHTDASGTRITDDNANGVITRVGARLYGRSTQNDNGIQPFVEANWWYSDAKNSLSFNGQTMEDGTPDSRYEVKVGLQGQVANDWLIWGHAGVQYGSNDFNRYEGMVGIKRMF